MKIAYFGSSIVSVYVLDELMKAGYTPDIIVTTPDKPQGRGLVMTPNIMKTYADEHGIPSIAPATFGPAEIAEIQKRDCDIFIVASYGRILPAEIVNMPRLKTLNMHPSLLPLYRGAAPLPTTILDDAKDTGITIMRMDEKMDHGPIVATKAVKVAEWPTYEVFEEMMAREGGRLLAQVLPEWASGKVKEIEQDHTRATFTKKIKKEDAQIDLAHDAYTNFRKIQAYHSWPGAYFFMNKNGRDIRVRVNQASYAGGKLKIEKVTPEGSKMMSYEDFTRGYGSAK